MSSILDGLNSEQKQAVSQTEGPVLIIAGAGTGKTTVITRRIAYIIEKKLAKPSEILALTFTEKAASEMEERVDVLVPYGYVDTWISTFHSFGNRILQEKALDLGLAPDFKVLTKPQQILFFQQNLFAFDLDYYRPLSNPTKFIEAILAFISRCKDEDISPEDYKKYVEKLKKTRANKLEVSKEEWQAEIKRQEELSNVYSKYEELKKQNSRLDYGDQISKTLDLFRTRPKILKEYQKKFKYILVDEFQDTNYAQNELVKLLANSHKNICVVGDDDQCLPAGTLVTLPKGSKEIEKLRVGDDVITAVGKGHLGISQITRVFRNRKTTRLLTIKTASNRKLILTDNHKVFCYVPLLAPKGQNHYVYLMYRQGLGWRIGVTNNLTTRLRLERSADKIIGLKAFKTDQEARYYEMVWSLQYGIPPTVFQERGNVIQGNLLVKLYKAIDSEAGVQKLASYLGIDLNSPHFILDAVTRGSSKRIKINLDICFRNYSSKVKGVLKNPKILHSLNLQTNNPVVINRLKKAGYKLTPAKKGQRLRLTSSNLVDLGKIAEKLVSLTNGFLEAKGALGIVNKQSKPALVMPAANLLPGHYLPVVKGNRVEYDQIIDVKTEKKTLEVYDLEIARTHNFIANDIVVHNSIYKFRGAAISNILKFKDDYPKTKQVVLTTNYRSTQNLLDASYRLIRSNDPDRLEVKNKINKKLISARKDPGETPKEISTQTMSEETDFVAGEIEKLIKTKKVDYKDIAILVRANSQADPFLRALNVKGIPYKFIGNSGLYQQNEIQLLIAFLNSISNFDDSLSLYQLATSEIYQLPLADCIKLMDYSKRSSRTLSYTFQNISKLPQIEISKEALAIVEKINEDLAESLEQSRRENAGQVLYSFLQKTRYLERLERDGSTESEIKIQNIAKFFDKIREFIDLVQNEGVRAFIDYLETMRLVGDDPATADFDPDLDAVNIMTVHAAKGLEFKVVFMVGLASDRFPSRERSEAIALPTELIKETLPSGDFHEQEERRLFYVGSTRAKDKLYYTWSKDTGGKRFKKISPFVLEALDKTAGEKEALKKNSRESLEQFAPKVKTLASVPGYDGKIIKLTQASIDDYETCAYKYRYAHVLRLPILRHHTVVYGFALHAAAAAYYQARMNQGKLSLEETYQVLENAWVNEGFLTAEHEEKRLVQAKEVIKAFWEREEASKLLPSFVEKDFRFNLTSGDTKVLVTGRYDRVDIEGDQVKILDYKSTENRTAEELDKAAKDSIQLKVYTLAYYKNYKVVPSFVGIYDLGSGLVGGYRPRKEDLAETESRVIEVAKQIRGNLQADNFPANPKYFGRNPACTYCAYNSICPFSLARK